MSQEKICKFHFVQGASRNVGKSLFASLLVEYFSYKSIDYRLVDGDRVNPDVEARYSVWGKSISGVALDGDIQSFDRIINLSKFVNCCVINLPVGNSNNFNSWLEENRRSDFMYYHWFLHDGSSKSTNILKNCLINYPSDRFILVHNFFSGAEISADLESLAITKHQLIKLPFIQVADSDLLLMEKYPLVPYSKLPFTPKGSRRWNSASASLFEKIDSILND